MNMPIYYCCAKCDGDFPDKDYDHEYELCNDCLKAQTTPVVNFQCSDLLVAKLIEIDSFIRCVHLDMGGNNEYHISPKHNTIIGKLIKECLNITKGK